MSKEESKEKVVLINRGSRAYECKSGKLVQGGSLAVTPEEAKDLLEYPGVMDASKIVKSTSVDSAALVKENGKLQKQVDALSKDLEDSLADNDKLKGDIVDLKAQIKELKEKVK
jgi:peptidoglycan hydrolase CwlO-like protein